MSNQPKTTPWYRLAVCGLLAASLGSGPMSHADDVIMESSSYSLQDYWQYWQDLLQYAVPRPDLVINDVVAWPWASARGTPVSLLVFVEVMNQGFGDAGTFRVSAEYQTPNPLNPQHYDSATFTSSGSSRFNYPTVSYLDAGDTVLVWGVVTLTATKFEDLAGKSILLKITADDCYIGNFVPATCTVDEADETNNDFVIEVPIPSL